MTQIATPVIAGFNDTANRVPSGDGDVWTPVGWTPGVDTAAIEARISELEMTITEAISEFSGKLSSVIVELRVMQVQLRDGLNITDEPEALRRDVEKDMGPDAPLA